MAEAPGPTAGASGGTCLTDLGPDLLQGILLHLPDVAAAAAAAPALAAAAGQEEFAVEWCLVRAAAAAPDRLWQVCVGPFV